MSQRPASLTVLGTDIAFKAGANMERVRAAIKYLEERYDAQEKRSGGTQLKTTLLTFLALDLADELLQMKAAQAKTKTRVECLLEKIEKLSQAV